MAVYYSIKCPNCNKEVESGKNRTSKYGSPLKVCKYCGAQYVDDNYIEAGLLDEDELYKVSISWQNVAWAFLGFVFLFLGIKWIEAWLIIFGIGIMVVAIIAVVSQIRYDPRKDENLKKELLASKERLKNPYYILALRKGGYSVPITFMRWAKKAIEEEN